MDKIVYGGNRGTRHPPSLREHAQHSYVPEVNPDMFATVSPMLLSNYEPRARDALHRCAYHAWRFDSDGKCVKIPQSERGGKDEARAAACIKPYPTQARECDLG